MAGSTQQLSVQRAAGESAIERDQGESRRLCKGEQVVVGPKLWNRLGPRRELPKHSFQTGRFRPEDDPGIQKQRIVGSPCLFLGKAACAYDGSLGEKPQKAHLGDAAEAKDVDAALTVEPATNHGVPGVSGIRES